jgi:hypothetical protein
MNYQPLLRDYRQMVRIIRNKENSATSYKLGNAYGKQQDSFSDIFANNGVTPTELQIRTLNEINVPSTSPRRPGANAEEGELPSRASSALYHDLNNTSKEYLNALGGDNGVRRSDGQPGTKLRTQLGQNSFATKVYAQSGFTSQTNHLTNTSVQNKPSNTKNSQLSDSTSISTRDSTSVQKHSHSMKQPSQSKQVQRSFNAFE